MDKGGVMIMIGLGGKSNLPPRYGSEQITTGNEESSPGPMFSEQLEAVSGEGNKPPNYTTSAERCGQCEYFDDMGRCNLYDADVEADAHCTSFEPKAAEQQQPEIE